MKAQINQRKPQRQPFLPPPAKAGFFAESSGAAGMVFAGLNQQIQMSQGWGSQRIFERNRAEVGLKLVSDLCQECNPSVAGDWMYPLQDEARRSFAAYLRPKITQSQLDHFFQQVANGTRWDQPIDPRSQQPVPRKTAWMVASTCRCTYKYGGLEVDPQEFPPWMIELMDVYMPLCGLTSRESWPNSCNLNLYEDGGMSVGWHSDDEVLFQGKHTDIMIISLSLGQTRTFEIRVDHPEDGERANHKIPLRSGDVMTMEGMTQKYYKHRVPKERALGPRINLTWRWVKKHNPRCPYMMMMGQQASNVFAKARPAGASLMARPKGGYPIG